MSSVPSRRDAIRVFVTGGTFDKQYDEIRGRLYFDDSQLPEMLRLGRCHLDLSTRTLMMVDSLEMSDDDRGEAQRVQHHPVQREAPAGSRHQRQHARPVRSDRGRLEIGRRRPAGEGEARGDLRLRRGAGRPERYQHWIAVACRSRRTAHSSTTTPSFAIEPSATTR